MTTVTHSEESFARVNGLEICYESFGEPDQPAILLVTGLGAQMVSWDAAACRDLAAAGYWVIRFDNRDVGRSTKLEQYGKPNVMAAFMGQPVDAPYHLRDMAADAVGLLDALGIDRAHVVGASMGGMIVQEMLIHHPDRIHTAVSIMSTTGDPDLPGPTPEATQVLLRPPVLDDRDAYVAQSVAASVVIGSTGFELDMEGLRRRAGTAYDRGVHPAGTARQMAAILGSGSRREALQSVSVPTLVIHGRDDPLVPVEGGIDTAAAIPGAELLIIEGMGHDIPPAAWPLVKKAILSHLTQAGS